MSFFISMFSICDSNAELKLPSDLDIARKVIYLNSSHMNHQVFSYEKHCEYQHKNA